MSQESATEKVSKIKDHIIVALGGVIFLLLAVLVVEKFNPEKIIENEQFKTEIEETGQLKAARLRYWGVNLDDWNENGCMRTMNRVFERLQFEFVYASNGDDWDILWSIDHPIDASSSAFAKFLFAGRKIVSKAESKVIKEMQKAGHSSHNYFELVRFDIIFDSKLNPYIMEVNMSPNLAPAEKRHEENTKLYEPLVYNTIQIIGGASHFEFHSRFNDSDITVAGQKHISVGVETCLKYDCYRYCDNPKCSICLPCVSSANRYQMREAVREHKYEGNFKRLFPTKLHYYDNELISNMTESNKISIKWFRAQCESNNKWC